MTKKVFALIITFLMIIFTSSIIFAEENMTAEWDDSVDKTKNTMHNIGNGIESAVDGVVDMGRNVVNGVTNNNMMNNDNNTGSNNNGNNNSNNNNNSTAAGITTNNSNYTAMRTSTAANTTNTGLFGLSNTAWTWIIMIITAAVIVSLIYYYGSQFENKTSMNNRNND